MTDDQKPQSDGSDGMGNAGRDNTGNSSTRISGVTYSVAAGLAALAGFIGVYMNLPPAGNAPAPAIKSPAQTQAQKPVEASGQGAAGQGGDATNGAAVSELKSYAKGDMGTFVVKKVPSPAPANLKFMDFSTGDDAGAAVTLDNWKGKVVLLNLWATWCAPCRKEMPDLLELKQELGGADFDVVTVSVDRGGPDKPRKFLKQIKAEDLGLYMGTSAETSGPLKVFGMPTTVLFDRQGREIGRLVGPADWASDDAKALIRAAIARAD